MDILLKRSDAELVEKFNSLVFVGCVADMLEVPVKILNYHLYQRSLSSSYKKFELNKKCGGTRLICAPIKSIKILQSKLNYILKLVYQPKSYVHGFLDERSILTNAQAHARASVVLNVDIEDFFPSIHFGRVRGMFMAKPYNVSHRAASVLAHLGCFEGHLPQGSPASPIISNMICGKMDSELIRLANRFRCRFTRYADDLTFSTPRKSIPSPLARLAHDESATKCYIGDLLKKTINENGFSVNERKLRMQHRGTRQEVTGLTINETPNVKRIYIKKIRSAIHAIETYGMELAQTEFHQRIYKKQIHPDREKPSLENYLNGCFAFLRMVKGESDKVYRSLYNRYQESLGNPRPYIVNPLSDVDDALWVLESESGMNQGSGFMLDGLLVTCCHVVRDDSQAFQATNFSSKFLTETVFKSEEHDIAMLRVLNGKKNVSLEAYGGGPIARGENIILAGFPNYREKDTPYTTEGKVAAIRGDGDSTRVLINTPIVAGNSGGAVLNSEGKVIGIAATGADRMEEASDTEHHSVIPISLLQKLTSQQGQPQPRGGNSAST